MGLRSLVRQATNCSTILILDAHVIFNSRNPPRPALPRAALIVRSGMRIVPSFRPLTTREDNRRTDCPRILSKLVFSCDLRPVAAQGLYAVHRLPHHMDANRSGVRVVSDREPAANALRPPFHWKSRLGVAVALFLIIGGVNFSLAVTVPITLHLFGPASAGGLVLSDVADSAFLGRPLSGIASSDPAMAPFLVVFMDTMCAFMMAFAVLQIGVAWYALRRAQMWALWSSLLSNLAVVPYYVAIDWTFAQRGVSVLVSLLVGFGVRAIVPIVATVVGRSGIQRVTELPTTAS